MNKVPIPTFTSSSSIMISKLLTLLLGILTVSTISLAQQKTTTSISSRIEKYIADVEKAGFAGTVLVELNGKKVLSKGCGYRNAEFSRKNTPHTIFDIGSLTKQFTATAILKLEMQGKLTTSDTITSYFQNVPADKSTITIHDLLRHQSGLQSNVGGDYEPIQKQAFIDTIMKSPLLFKIGTEFSYSNIGYSLLALIIEKVTGQPYEQYLYENLWKPSKMEETGYSRPRFDTSQIAVGYGKNNLKWGKPTDKQWNGSAPYLHLLGNGGILSTTEDLFIWHKALMSDRILSKAAKEKLYHPAVRLTEQQGAIYAYGWDVSKTKRKTYRVWHNGTNNIFYADFMRFIDEKTTVIVMANKFFRGVDQMTSEIAKIIFEKNYEPTIPKPDNATNQKFSQEIIDVIVKSGLSEATQKYRNRPSNTDILEYLLNRSGYQYLSQLKYDLAIDIFSMNCLAYPTSYNAFDSLAEAYMSKGDKPLAIKNYRRSLELDPTNRNAEDMIKKLEQ